MSELYTIHKKYIYGGSILHVYKYRYNQTHEMRRVSAVVDLKPKDQRTGLHSTTNNIFISVFLHPLSAVYVHLYFSFNAVMYKIMNSECIFNKVL